MKRYFFMVHFVPEEANCTLLMGRCISIMHGYISRHSIEGVGVTLPAWSDISIGNVIAFTHSDSYMLNELRQQSYFQDMQECGFFKLGQVDDVPNDCIEVKFRRNQQIAKMFVGGNRRRLKRLKKRALVRGEPFSPERKIKSREFEVFHRIAISSKSSQQDYLLHIQRDVVDKQEEPEFSCYGFASNSKLNGTVPELSLYIGRI
ncbi:type I-F CRISPR-associated endoribonuclease Cas6/Csy4 [Psychromonas hadalis]|uniref:type I-F CRISPR-associated endoribonuclease Cas6/Csy4 n=1 Tax=Psychromonas hadalis TaxID=211669 RepID=UPI0003B46CC6|nr:type I-F CRISPR-associated endoribonuclease Cas6/Csy4 [Psychromonas hadalis]